MSSKNIIVKNTTYNGIESVVFPVSGGGNASFYEVSDTTATASDVLSGKYFYTSSGIKTAGTGSGGGTTSAEEKQINFIDYDGTILYSYTSSEWANISSLPNNPSHSGLTAQGWNWTKNQIDTQLTNIPNGKIWVGQMYVTSSGDTEIDVEFVNSERLSPTLTIAVNGDITVDWGDNTTASTVTGTSLTTRIAVDHTYASTGKYTIKIHVVSGSFKFHNSTGYLLLRKSSSLTSGPSMVYANCVKAVRFGTGVTSIGRYAFNYCTSLLYVTIPNNITSIEENAFYYCYSILRITIPNTVTSTGTKLFSQCTILKNVSLPYDITTITTTMFETCGNLTSITIPNTTTSIGDNSFNYCYSLSTVTIPSTVTSIGTYAFQYCYGVKEYHIKPTTPPTIGTMVFGSISPDCIMYVPSASLSDYQGASNWSSYASYMQGE